jgi:tyrosinase
MNSQNYFHPSRRTLLKASAATLGVSALAMPTVTARAQELPQRPSLTSPAGIQMLALYAAAVNKMKNPAINLPNPPAPWSWTFQAYIHSFPIDPTDDQSNAYRPGTAAFNAKIDEIYGVNPTGEIAAWKQAALKCWSTCTHGSIYFLPWHRWYMYYFEEVLRSVLGVQSFMLPYWPYASNDSSSLQLPAAFRIVVSPLYERNRGFGFASGTGGGPQNVPMNSGGYMNYPNIDYFLSLATPPYFPADVTIFGEPGSAEWNELGYTGRAEIQPHDNVHDAVGGLMGNVPTAAQDPIFFMHHCQIDHLWASWQSYSDSTLEFASPPGTENFPTEQTWDSATWYFVNGSGALVTANAPSAVDYTALGYQYDSLVPQPPSAPPVMMASADMPKASAKLGARELLASTEPVAVKAGGATATVSAPQVKGLMATENSGTLSLILKDVRLINRPNGILSVFVNLPAGVTPRVNRPENVGQINLFRLIASGGTDAHAEHMTSTDPHVHSTATYAFPLSPVLAAQMAAGKWDGSDIRVTIATTGSPEEAGTTFVEIGAIEIR